jgi:phosphate transport system substrate-binding protein
MTSAVAVASLIAAPAAYATNIDGDGSSYAGKMINQCITTFSDHKVTYGSAGSTTGLSKYADGAVDFAGSDYPYLSNPPKNMTYVPLVGGPIAISWNVPGVRSLNLNAKILSDIYTGKITKWNDKAIKAVNKGVVLPNKAIVPIYRKDGSGTTYNFLSYLNENVPNTWKLDPKFINANANVKGIQGDKNQGVAAEIKKNAYSIGYIDLADANANKFPVASVLNGSGQYIKASVPTTKLFMLSSAHKLDSAGVVDFDYKAKVRGAYPIVLIAYGVAPTAGGNAEATAVKEFFNYVVNTCVPQYGAKLGYMPFTGTKFLAVANTAIAKIK